jgi:phospholipid/cholesterol/gamma-HCH transport system permease protein
VEVSSKIAIVDRRLVLAGELRIHDAPRVWATLRDAIERVGEFDVDLTRADVVDGAVMSLLVAARAELASRGVRSEILGGTPAVRRIVHLYGGDEPSRPTPARVSEGVLESLGRAIERLFASAERATSFFGELLGSMARIVRRPGLVNWRALPSLTERAGADGIPIVILLNFLVGFVMAFQSARQLKLYGANVFVADVVGISVTRELSPPRSARCASPRRSTPSGRWASRPRRT